MTRLAERHNVQIRGTVGAPVVFAHGFGCDQMVWKDVAPALETDAKTVLFDLAGSGKADRSLFDRRRHASLAGYAEDVIALLDDLGLQRVHFVAHSVSAMIAGVAAIRRPDLFGTLIMIGPSACYLNLDGYSGGFERDMLDDLIELLESNYIDWAKMFAPVVIGTPPRPGQVGEFVETLCRTDPECAGSFARVTFFSDSRHDVPKIRVPVVILQCQDDVVAPDMAVQWVHRAIEGSRLIQLDATGHCPHITHPAETVSALRGVLAGLQDRQGQ